VCRESTVGVLAVFLNAKDGGAANIAEALNHIAAAWVGGHQSRTVALKESANRLPKPRHPCPVRIVHRFTVNSHHRPRAPRRLAIHPGHVEARPSRCSAHPTAPAAEPMHPAVVDPLPKHPNEPAASNRMQFRYPFL